MRTASWSGRGDRLGNIEQLRALRRGGYRGPLSFEPFAAELRHLADPAAAIAEHGFHIRAELAKQKANPP